MRRHIIPFLLSVPMLLQSTIAAGSSDENLAPANLTPYLTCPLSNDDTASHLIAGRTLNYRPSRIAKRLRSKAVSGNLVGVLVPDIRNPFYIDVLAGIDRLVAPGNVASTRRRARHFPTWSAILSISELRDRLGRDLAHLDLGTLAGASGA